MMELGLRAKFNVTLGDDIRVKVIPIIAPKTTRVYNWKARFRVTVRGFRIKVRHTVTKTEFQPKTS